MRKPKCVYCGSEEKLHVYGQTDPGMSRDLKAPEPIHACNKCDPTVNMEHMKLIASYLGLVKRENHS
jgi:hypothetical protein